MANTSTLNFVYWPECALLLSQCIAYTTQQHKHMRYAQQFNESVLLHLRVNEKLLENAGQMDWTVDHYNIWCKIHNYM